MPRRIKNLLNHATSLGGRANNELTRFLRFTTVGVFSISVNIILLSFFVEILGIYYVSSVAIVFFIVTSINYMINLNWGFKGTKRKSFHGYGYFFFFDVLTLILIIALVGFFVEQIGIHYLFSRVLAGAIAGTINFIVNSKITFKFPVLK